MDAPLGPGSGPVSGAPDEPQRRACPACGESIAAAAKVCRFCKTEFDAQGNPKPKATPGRDTSRRTCLIVMAVLVVLLLLVLIVPAVLLLPVLARAREQARRASCANNLFNIYKCCELYADGNGGRYPERLSQLYPGFVKDLRVFNCPSATTGGAPKVTTAGEIETNTNYLYHPDADVDDPKAVWLEEKRGNHGQEGRNVLHRDGNLEFKAGP